MIVGACQLSVRQVRPDPSTWSKPPRVRQISPMIWDAPCKKGASQICERPGRTPVQECGTISIVQASGRAGPRCAPWPPAGSDGLLKRKNDIPLRIVIGRGGGVKADIADIFPLMSRYSRSGALWARAAVAHSTFPLKIFWRTCLPWERQSKKLSNPLSIRLHPDLGISSSCQLQVRPKCQRNGSCHQRPKISDAPQPLVNFDISPCTCYSFT